MKRLSIDNIELKEMSFIYENREKVFSNFNFESRPGEILFIQGQRGSGKNTFMKILLGLLPIAQGEYLINGTCVNNFSFGEFDRFRLNIGHSFDVGGLINNHSLYENFRILLDYHAFLPSNERFDYIVQMMEQFQLENHKHLRPALVSSSFRKAACVLRAFALRPEMVILDNPTQGMSMEHIPLLVRIIKEHQLKHSLKHVIISSDDVGLIAQLDGKVVQVTSSGLLEEKQVRRAS